MVSATRARRAVVTGPAATVSAVTQHTEGEPSIPDP
ncbi:hypothetical protein EV191_110172 [Tamaricihabitans halophyticus]|uniref:Uncharacterized protein n=1 Tax=Tamaricihabitans halophyticus TaxID=1262583 RepID=A0A4R2QH74_9PSEU|nr:hypothetical protein EV191_110172 [Tamaricihabitans halophyticus]